MVCDTYLQKPIVKSKVPGNFCKRLNTFDDFWGCRFVWHPKDTKSGPPPGVDGQSGTPKVVPHPGWPGHLAPKGHQKRSPTWISSRFPVDFRSVSGQFPSKIARNGSGIYENQHNLVKMARNFDASPAVTTGMRHDP